MAGRRSGAGVADSVGLEAEDRAEAEQDELVEQLAESLAIEANDIWDAMSDLNREKKRVIAKRLLAKYNVTPKESE